MSPRRIAPFARGTVLWARVPRIGHPAVQRSLGVTDVSEAREVCRFLEWLRGRGARSAYLLDAMADGRVAVLAVYRAYVENRLDAFEQELRAGIADPDLEPYVARWEAEMARRKRPAESSRAKYVGQVRTLLVAGKRFPRSQFTKSRIRQWLAELPVAQPNRHRSALSSFARFLLLEDVLATNPVRDVPMAKENEPRVLYLSPEDAAKLVEKMPPAAAAIHALMIATGMEVSAALAVRRRDLTIGADGVVTAAYARGTKRTTRKRTVHVYWRWRGLWRDHVAPYLATRPGLPEAKLFAELTYGYVSAALVEALEAADLERTYRNHDHRHTWAVQAVRDRIALHVVGRQLGHKDAAMAIRCYARFEPREADFDVGAPAAESTPAPRSATPSATPPIAEGEANAS